MTPSPSDPALNDTDSRLNAVLAGYRGDQELVQQSLISHDPLVRVAGLGALSRLGLLDAEQLRNFANDVDYRVRRRVAELAASWPTIDLLPLLNDDHESVVEMAAWACGEHVIVSDIILDRLIHLTLHGDDPLIREAAVAALGAIGDQRGLPAILQACKDKPAIRRRAVLALAPFVGADVDAAIEAALQDRDWQVRQAAEDIRA
jgi:HEAT repeat protein